MLFRWVSAITLTIFVFAVQSMSLAQQKKSTPGPAGIAGSMESLEYDKVFFTKKKDPVLGGMLSWYVPGLGQYYSEQYVKGTAFLVTEYALIIGGIFYFMNFDFSAGGGSGFNLRVDAKRTNLGVVETSRRNVFYGILGAVAVIHLYNVSDAVVSARRFNRRLDQKRNEMKQRYPNLEFSFDGRKVMYIGIQERL